MRSDEQHQGGFRVLAQALRRRIDERTHGRLHQLRVETAGDRLIVHGWTRSYHGKQIALHAISGFGGPIAVEVDIRVGAEAGTNAVHDDAGNMRPFAVRVGLVERFDVARSRASDPSESGSA